VISDKCKMRKEKMRKIRHKRIRKTVFGTKERPRLCVFRSNKHIYAQIISDVSLKALVSASTLSKELKATNLKSTTQDAAQAVGKLVAQKAKKAGITSVCFDRGGYKYHGQVKKLADGAREGGLKF
jgi:large subunit ribosomal protein L18